MDWVKIVGAFLYSLVFLMVVGIGMTLMDKPEPAAVIVDTPPAISARPIAPAAGPGIAWGQRPSARQVR